MYHIADVVCTSKFLYGRLLPRPYFSAKISNLNKELLQRRRHFKKVTRGFPMKDEDEVLSDSETSDPNSDSDSGEEFTADCQDNNDDEEEELDSDVEVVSKIIQPSSTAHRKPPSDEDRKSTNVDALVRGNLVVKRQSLLPRVLSVTEGSAVCRKPFKPPCSDGYSSQNDELARRLWARKRFVPWGSSRPALVAITNRLNIPDTAEKDVVEEIVTLPPGFDPLVLWQSEELDANMVQIAVDPLLVRFLRPHQSLGKTLQSITLLYTLLFQGFDGKPMVKKAIIVTPTSLVSNWEAEIKKWIGERVQLIALCESTRDDALAALPCKRRILLSGTPMQNDLEEFFAMVNFTNPGILGDVAHFRRYYEAPIICGREPNATEEERKLGVERSAELSAKVNQFILRRTNALLSNHLPPKLSPNLRALITNLENVAVPICIQEALQHPEWRKELMCNNQAATSIAKNPVHHDRTKHVKRAISEEVKQSKILAYITALKKLCNHPKLIYDTIRSGSPGTSGFEDCIRFFPPEMFSGRSGSWTGGDGAWVELSGKMYILARLLAHLRHKTDDRIVLVSNYTQTLDLFAQLCRERRYPYLRLDGTTSISKRQKLVNHFNDPTKDEFVFLLSSKAGGCGLNLIGGNRLVLFDPDWNPANDKQAAARVWRDGQKKRVYIYRFLSTGTIEEKIFQRQMSKEGLQKVIQQEQKDSPTAQGNLLSMEDLRDLFSFHENARSEIHDKMNCIRCQSDDDRPEIEKRDRDQIMHGSCQADQDTSDIGGFAEIAGCLDKLKRSEKQMGTPLEENLGSWGHHFFPTSVPDAIFQASAGDEVSFVFTNQVDGKLVPIDSIARPRMQETEENVNHPKSKQNLNQKTMLSRNRKPLESVISNHYSAKNTLSAPYKPLQRANVVRVTSSLKCSLQDALKPKPSLGNHLPQKRLSPDTLEHDDDFQ
ncbi:DNA repair protein rhp54 [Morus notabilis]|uniref:DNA repair protein rhp54 n=1 Tax=Morus notabilis TaxID=981085 RepID=W9RY74_9ROSA|nr:DNA repair protein rhp54 [Morus notabilis]